MNRMKNHVHRFLLFVLTVGLLSSCTLSKRQHQPGFYFSWNKKAKPVVQSEATKQLTSSESLEISDTLIQQEFPKLLVTKDSKQLIQNVKNDVLNIVELKESKISEPTGSTEEDMLRDAEELEKFNQTTKRIYLPLSLVLALTSFLVTIITIEAYWSVNPTLYGAIMLGFISLVATIGIIRLQIKLSRYRRSRRAFLRSYKSYESHQTYRAIKRSILPNQITSFFISIAMFFTLILAIFFGLILVFSI